MELRLSGDGVEMELGVELELGNKQTDLRFILRSTTSDTDHNTFDFTEYPLTAQFSV